MYRLDGNNVVIVGTIKGEHCYFNGQKSRLHKVQFTQGKRTGELTLAHRYQLKPVK